MHVTTQRTNAREAQRDESRKRDVTGERVNNAKPKSLRKEREVRLAKKES